MKILLLHHFETMWEDSLKKYNTDFENQLNKYMDYIITNKDNLDKVIITRFEGFKFEPEHSALIDLCENLNIKIENQEYAYGWTKDMNEDLFSDENENIKWCYGTRDHHDENDVLIIDDWMNELKGHTVYLGGAFANECVLDAYTALKAANVNVIECDDLIVGTYENYEFKTKITDIYSILDDVEELNELYEKLENDYDLENLNIDEFNEIKDELIKLEKSVNEAIYENLDLIKLLRLSENIYEYINNDNFKEIVYNIIDQEAKFENFSNLSDQFTLSKVKEKLKDNNPKTKKIKLKQ